MSGPLIIDTRDQINVSLFLAYVAGNGFGSIPLHVIVCPPVSELTVIINSSYLNIHPEMTMDSLTNELTISLNKTEQEIQYEVFEMVSWVSDVPNCFAK